VAAALNQAAAAYSGSSISALPLAAAWLRCGSGGESGGTIELAAACALAAASSGGIAAGGGTQRRRSGAARSAAWRAARRSRLSRCTAALISCTRHSSGIAERELHGGERAWWERQNQAVKAAGGGSACLLTE